MGVPGWPEFAFCTPSIDSVRIVLTQSSSSVVASSATETRTPQSRGRMAAETVLSEAGGGGKGWGVSGVRGRPMYARRLSLKMTLMHPNLMTILANELPYDLRADAVSRRRGRSVLSRARRASARRL